MDMENPIRGWPILLVLYYVKKIPLHIKLQKMLFLVLSEAKLRIPYDFRKYDHGPYDPEIKIDFLTLGKDGYINVTHHVKSERDYWIFAITKKGEEYVEKIILKSFSQKDLKRVERLAMKYNKMDWKELVSIVYEKYNIERSELDRQKGIIINELSRIRPLWSVNYEKNNCEYTFTSLALIDYMIIMLNKKRFDGLDITQYNVLINCLAEMMNHLKMETASFSLCEKTDDCITKDCEKLCEIKEMFLYVQYLGEKFKILPATFSEDACMEDFDFEDKKELQGDELRTAVKTT